MDRFLQIPYNLAKNLGLLEAVLFIDLLDTYIFAVDIENGDTTLYLDNYNWQPFDIKNGLDIYKFKGYTYDDVYKAFNNLVTSGHIFTHDRSDEIDEKLFHLGYTNLNDNVILIRFDNSRKGM